MGETVPLDFVSRWSGLSPWVVCGHGEWPIRLPLLREAVLRSRPWTRSEAGSVIACGPRRHLGAGHVLSIREVSKPADGRMPNRQAELDGVGSDAAEDVTSLGIPCRCRPKWKRQHSADTETGDVGRPRSYDLRCFTGKLNQPNCEVRSGQCMKRSDCESQPVRVFPLFEVARLREDSQA